MELEKFNSASQNQIDFLTKQINLEAKSRGIITTAEPFSFVLKEGDSLIAGCNGSIVFGTIYTDQLWVDPRYRRRGLARKLMEAVHTLGRKNGCHFATISTMSFQDGKSFYEKLGYLCDFERKGYAQGSSCFFMKKPL